jgi:tRNA(fMet)-specific endonuclease VapC
MEDAYLLDTGVASIAWDVGHPKHEEMRSRLAALGSASIAVCSITLGEVSYGLEVTPAVDEARHHAVRQAMESYYIYNVDKHTVEVYAKLRGELFKQFAPRNMRGRLKTKWPEDLIDSTTSKELGIQENDLWIVSVAIQYDLRFITTDKMQHIAEVAKRILDYDLIEVWQ